MARLFRQARGLRDAGAVDLEAVLEEDEIVVGTAAAKNPGFTASLIRFQEGKGGGIYLEAGQSPGRRRFSIAHELAHFHMPGHKKARLQGVCTEENMRARGVDPAQMEWEANDFAAELLMPRRLFAADVQNQPVSFQTVERLASEGMYNVSLTAAAWRIVELSREPCALIVSTNERISWIVKSDALGLWIPERGQPVHRDSCAGAVCRGEAVNAKPEPVNPAVWFESDYPILGELLESTHSIPAYGQLLSLLWLVSDTEGE